MTTIGAAARRCKSVRFVVVPEVATRINGLLSGQFDFICDVPPDQIPGIEKNPKFEVQGSTIVNHRITVFDKNHPQLADPRIRQAFTHAIDRQAIVDSAVVGPHRACRAGLQWEFYGPMFVEDWTVPAYDLAKAKALLKAGQLQGRSDPLPPAQQLLHQPGRDRAGAGRDVARRRPQRADRDEGELAADLRRATARAPCATGPTAPASTIRSPRSSPSTGRRASSSRSANGPTRR